MEGLVHISFTKIDFYCPACGEHHSDDDDKYLMRCNRNKQGWTRLICTRCGERFGMTYDMTGSSVGFSLGKK